MAAESEVDLKYIDRLLGRFDKSRISNLAAFDGDFAAAAELASACRLMADELGRLRRIRSNLLMSMQLRD